MLESIQRNVTWRAIPVAALVAGTVFLVAHAVLAVTVLEVDATLILRYIGSIVQGPEVLMDNTAGPLAVGLVVHYLLSFLFTLLIAIVIHRWGLIIGIIGGAIMGLAIYGITLYSFTAWFEWFFAINSNVLLLCHVLFGATAGGVYELFDHYDVEFDLEVAHDPA